jgi:hypothetical protein
MPCNEETEVLAPVLGPHVRAGDDPRTLMFLHGYGESADLASMSTVDLKKALAGKGHKLLPPVDAPLPLKSTEDLKWIPDEEYRAMCESGDLTAYAWYPFLAKGNEGGHRKEGVKDFEYRSTKEDQMKAAKVVVDAIDKLGGVDGIIGFSQGGELAYLVLEYLAGEDVPKYDWAKRLEFVATFGSEDPFLQRGGEKLKKVHAAKVFICYGEHDKDAEVDAVTAKKSLHNAGAIKAMTYRVMGLDHHMPKLSTDDGRGAYDAMIALMVRDRFCIYSENASAGANYGDFTPPEIGKKMAIEKAKTSGPRVLDELMADPTTSKFTWEIPPEAPPGWGMGRGEEWLIENCGLYRPMHPKWRELNPEKAKEVDEENRKLEAEREAAIKAEERRTGKKITSQGYK